MQDFPWFVGLLCQEDSMKCWKKERITNVTSMSLIGHVLPPHLSTSKITNFTSQNVTPKPILFTNLFSLALTVTLNSPLPSLAIPSLNSQPPLLSPTTPFSQSKNLQIGLENGYVNQNSCVLQRVLFCSHFLGLNVGVLVCMALLFWIETFDSLQFSDVAGKLGLARQQTQVVFQRIRNLHHFHSHGGFLRMIQRMQFRF